MTECKKKIEIGSEFWDADISESLIDICDSSYDSAFLLSGRTALDFVIRDIVFKLNRGFSAYLPSYCCETMIEPFINNGCSVDFYNVDFVNGKFVQNIDIEKQCDVVLTMQYFGFVDYSLKNVIDEFKSRETIVIEDATHSFFSCNRYHNNSDYVFCSFRKWTGINAGAIALKNCSLFSIKKPDLINNKYIEFREKANEIKSKYIYDIARQSSEKTEQEYNSLKTSYLQLYNDAESLLSTDYSEYSIPQKIADNLLHLDAEKIINKRKENIKYLSKSLEINSQLEISKFDLHTDTPLFLPIKVKNNQRNQLRDFLIQEKVYCPVHWPLSILHNASNEDIYLNNLSIVCDQRYDVSDMERIVNLIKQFTSEEKFC